MIKLGLISNNCPNRIDIGHEQENIVEQIQFDITAWVAAYGAGSASLVVQRAGDTSPYPVTVDLTDGIVTWTVSSTDTSVQGYGEIQLTYIVGEAVKKSAVMRFFCGRSLTGETPAPDPYEAWLQTLQEIAADAEGSASDASNSATEAAGSATAAAESAQDARAAADSIGDSVEQAQAASEQARASATLAAGYASDAQTAAASASASATSAETSASAAAEAVTAAQGYAQTASSAAESAETSASEAAASAAAVDGLAPLIEANRITDTASGSIASFPDGAGDIPMDHLIVSIEPVQNIVRKPTPERPQTITGWDSIESVVGSESSEYYKWIQKVVGLGMAPKKFPVGTKIPVDRNGFAINMVVMGYIENGRTPKGDIVLKDGARYGMILQSEKLLYSLQSDNTEAFYYAASALPAGTYHVTLGDNYDVANGGGATYQFTLTKQVPAGGQIVWPWAYNQQAANARISTYASGSDRTALESGVVVTAGTGGTDLGTVLIAVQESAGLNSIHRMRYGSNKWSESAMRQHLNSSKVAGSVWSPQSHWDRPPSWDASTAGFMHGLDPEFIKICADVELLTALSTAAGDTSTTEGSAGTGYETTVDKYFLPSRPEVFGGGDNASDKGDAWQYYSANSDKSAQANNSGADSNRIKVGAATGNPYYWWLRSPNVGSGYAVRIIHLDGNITGSYASNSGGVAPACVIAGIAPSEYTTYTTSLGQTVYGGTLDVVTGELSVDRAVIASYAGETIAEPWISSMDVYSAGATPTTGAQVVYPITPQTYTLTPTEVKTLLGANNVWADAGIVEVTYTANLKDYLAKIMA